MASNFSIVCKRVCTNHSESVRLPVCLCGVLVSVCVRACVRACMHVYLCVHVYLCMCVCVCQ